MKTQYITRILEDGEIKIPLENFDNFKGNDIVDFDYEKYEIMKFGGEENWLSLSYYEKLIVAYKYQLIIELQNIQLIYLSNDVLNLQDLIIKYTPIVQKQELLEDFKFLSKLTVQELEYQAKKRNYQ